MSLQNEIPDIITPADRPVQASGCPVAWESWFAELSTWINAASVAKNAVSGTIQLRALGSLVHVHGVVDWDGASVIDVGQPCAVDSAFLVASESGLVGSGWMVAGSSGIIVRGLVAGRIVVSGWYPALLGDDRL